MTATAGPDNQLLTVNGATQTYDLRGNLRKGVLPSGTMGSLAETYTFDARNRLTSMEGGHSFAYDVANNRIGITSGTSTTDFYLTPLGGLSQVVSEKTTTVGSDAASYERFYIYTPQGQLLYHLDPDMAGDISSTTRFKASHYHYDLTGSTVALSGDDGLVKGRVFYTPYGEITHRDAAVDTRFLFCGAYGVQTDASGLVHMRARYYHPYLARFLNEDPIEFEGGMNWYAYVNGNPLNLVDPTGLWSPGGHDALLNHAFAKRLPASEVQTLQKLGRDFDANSQDPSEAYKHAMARPFQSPKAAAIARYEFVQRQIALAKEHTANNDRLAALIALTPAMHAIMDYSSPMHTTKNGMPRKWYGMTVEASRQVGTFTWHTFDYSDNIKYSGHSPNEFIGIETAKDINPETYEQNDYRLRSLYNQVFGKNSLPEPSSK